MSVIPVLPKPETEEILLKMVELIIENPLVTKIRGVYLFLIIKTKSKFNTNDLNSLKEFKGIGPSVIQKLKEAGIKTIEDLITSTPEELAKTKGIGINSAKIWLNKASLKEFEFSIGHSGWAFGSKECEHHPLPEGKDGVRKLLEIARAIKNQEVEILPEFLQDGELVDYSIHIRMDWKDFQQWVEINSENVIKERKLEFVYYPHMFPSSIEVWDKKGYLSYLSPPFIKLFREFKKIFHEKWPNKYLLIPYDTDNSLNVRTKNKLLHSLKKEIFEPSKYKKIDDFF